VGGHLRNWGQIFLRIRRWGSTIPISRTMLQGSWSVTGKFISGRIQFEPAAHHDLLQQREATLPGDDEIAPLGLGRRMTIPAFVGVAALSKEIFRTPSDFASQRLADGGPGQTGSRS